MFDDFLDVPCYLLYDNRRFRVIELIVFQKSLGLYLYIGCSTGFYYRVFEHDHIY